MEIYIAKNKTQMGPYDISQVTQMLQTRILEKYDLYWHEGMLDWAPVASLSKVNAAQKVPPTEAVAVSPYPPNQTQYFPPNYNQGGSEPLATWSLVLGLLGLFCLGILAGIPAVVCGHLAISNMNRNPALQGKGQATAGLILGYLGSIFSILFAIAVYRR